MALITHYRLQELKTALIDGLGSSYNRITLLQGIDYQFVSTIYNPGSPIGQITNDLGKMNQIERLPSGVIPMQIYLSNALQLMYGAKEQEILIREILQEISRTQGGLPEIEVSGLTEFEEKIIHKDDTVSFSFMEQGVSAGAAVAQLKVHSFMDGNLRKLNGKDLIFLGTGWLIAKTLLVTNYHVIHARKLGETAASTADFVLQAANTEIIFDFNYQDVQTAAPIKAIELVADNKSLDYAILRISDTDRTPLKIDKTSVDDQIGELAVNIIQHPGGLAKRYGIRNNLVTASTATELRYFTDTDQGSSGSPVLNDEWKVLALHRAAVHVKSVMYQGKATAYVNTGTPITAIVEDIRKNYKILAGELGF